MTARRLLYWHAFFIPASAVVGLVAGGWWTFLTLGLLFLIDPLLDPLIPPDRRNPQQHEIAGLEQNRVWRWPLYLALPVQLGLIVLGLWALSNLSLSLIEIVGLTVSIGLSSGALGITVAHELMHRNHWSERFVASALMMSASYPHFSIEHVHGHHRNVGLRDDPATARRGEGFYTFFGRVLLGSLRSAWQIECLRLARRDKNPHGPANRLLRYGIGMIVVYVMVLIVFGWVGVAFFAAQCFVAVMELELTNYVEHYGLVRKDHNGTPERVAAHHAWDTDSPLTNWYLFQLGRHADHHLHPGRRYQLLESLPDSPRLPAGYSAMLLLALIPPLWRGVMDRRIDTVAGATGETALRQRG